jgi:hypothetical protein
MRSLQDKLSQKQKPDYPFDKTTGIRFEQFSCNFGNPAVREGPVAFRPTIARGLALSRTMIQNFFFTDIAAISMPRTNDLCNGLIFKMFYEL